MARNAPRKLPDTPADNPGGGGRRPPPPGVLDSVSWNLPECVSSHFEGPGESTPPENPRDSPDLLRVLGYPVSGGGSQKMPGRERQMFTAIRVYDYCIRVWDYLYALTTFRVYDYAFPGRVRAAGSPPENTGGGPGGPP